MYYAYVGGVGLRFKWTNPVATLLMNKQECWRFLVPDDVAKDVAVGAY